MQIWIPIIVSAVTVPWATFSTCWSIGVARRADKLLAQNGELQAGYISMRDTLIAERHTKTAAVLNPSKAEKPYHIPGPYEIALAVGAALVTTGKYDTPGAALDAAWMAVPEYFTGRDRYLAEMVPMMRGMAASAGQGSELPEWAHDPRADVPGGEMERGAGEQG